MSLVQMFETLSNLSIVNVDWRVVKYYGKTFSQFFFFQRWKMSHIQSIVTGEKAYPMKSKQVFTVYFEGVYLLWIQKADTKTVNYFSLLEKPCKIISVERENQINSHIRIPRQYSTSPLQVVGAGSDRPSICSSARAWTTFQPRKGFTFKTIFARKYLMMIILWL